MTRLGCQKNGPPKMYAWLVVLIAGFSLFSAIKFSGAFRYLVIAMISFAVLFLILRTIHRFRDSFKIREKK